MILCPLFFLFVSVITTTVSLRRLQEPLSERPIQTRRILRGKSSGNTRPYMVYLRLASPEPADSAWLCGGVIIHPRHILTSAACIHGVTNFYVISGTNEWMPASETSSCIIYGAKRAVSKYIPKDYIYDGNEFNNIRWMANDIAIVKVDEEFNFARRVRGCNYIPQMIPFNNQSEQLEDPKTEAYIAGWGSTEKFSELELSASNNSRDLLESKLNLMSKASCKERWPERYHSIIDRHMICASDASVGLGKLLCDINNDNCKEADNLYDEQPQPGRKAFENPESMVVHTASEHMNGSRRFYLSSGGFCENDHGGPLIVGRGKRALVAGVIAACLVKGAEQRCQGPFLFTSVWRNRHLIDCVINDDMGGEACRNLFESRKIAVQQTQFEWSSFPIGRTRVEFSDEEVATVTEVATDNKASLGPSTSPGLPQRRYNSNSQMEE